MAENSETTGAEAAGGYRGVLAGIGLAQGLVWWAASGDPASNTQLTISAFALVSGLTGQFLWTGRDVGRWAALSGTFGVIVGALSFWVFDQISVNAFDHERLFTWVLGAFALLYVLVPFAQITQRTGRAEFPYEQLFLHSWNNFFIGLVGAIFVQLFSLLILLGQGLFSILGIEVYETIVWSDPFVFLIYPTLFGLGIAMGRESEGVLNTLKRIALSLCHVLLPVLAVLALAFLLGLFFAGLQPLWETGHTTPLLLAVVAFTLLFVNAVFQDGSTPPPYIPLVRHGVEALLLANVIFIGIAAYSTGLRVGQYGLTPARVWAVVLVSVAALYSLGYAAAVLHRRSGWMELIRPVNVGAAWTIAALVIATHSPLLDPSRLSANSQAHRLISGQVSVEEFDFAFMQFRLGKPGQRWLERLAQLEDHPEAEKIREAVRLAQAEESYYPARHREGQHAIAAKIEPVPPLKAIPGELRATIADELDPVYARCQRDSCFLVYPIDLDGDGGLEYCLIDATGMDYSQRCYARTRYGDWSLIGNFLFSEGTRPELDQLRAAVEIRGVQREPPLPRQYSDLRIGEAIFRLSEGEGVRTRRD